MSYKIKPLQIKKAKSLNLTIKPSKNKKKKVDVFNSKGEKVGSVGALGYMDYASYIEKDGLTKANEKRKNYLKRHAKEPKMKDGKRTNSFYADAILWS
tara:strand:+ start:262 stop:555 length:294 start_codon:yes stop_codon:yes gene_type:complete